MAPIKPSEARKAVARPNPSRVSKTKAHRQPQQQQHRERHLRGAYDRVQDQDQGQDQGQVLDSDGAATPQPLATPRQASTPREPSSPLLSPSRSEYPEETDSPRDPMSPLISPSRSSTPEDELFECNGLFELLPARLPNREPACHEPVVKLSSPCRYEYPEETGSPRDDNTSLVSPSRSSTPEVEDEHVELSPPRQHRRRQPARDPFVTPRIARRWPPTEHAIRPWPHYTPLAPYNPNTGQHAAIDAGNDLNDVFDMPPPPPPVALSQTAGRSNSINPMAAMVFQTQYNFAVANGLPIPARIAAGMVGSRVPESESVAEADSETAVDSGSEADSETVAPVSEMGPPPRRLGSPYRENESLDAIGGPLPDEWLFDSDEE